MTAAHLNDRIALARALVAVAVEAGDAIRRIQAEGGAKRRLKADYSPVTDADLAADAVIEAALARLSPDIEVLSEERKSPFRPGHAPARYWAVDPLDGTREFLDGTGDYTVNIALIEAGVPTLGVVHAPASGRSWVGVAGHGAWAQDAGAGPAPIVTCALPDGQRPTVVVSRTHDSSQLNAMLSRLVCGERLKVGSSLKLCAVADGRAHLYPRIGTTCIWDLAAGQAVLEAAGGTMLDLKGAPLRFPDPCDLEVPGFLACADRAMAAEALAALKA